MLCDYLNVHVLKMDELIKNNKPFCFHTIRGYTTIKELTVVDDYYLILLDNKQDYYEKYDWLYIEGNNPVPIEDVVNGLFKITKKKALKVGDKVSYAAGFDPFGSYETLESMFNDKKKILWKKDI